VVQNLLGCAVNPLIVDTSTCSTGRGTDESADVVSSGKRPSFEDTLEPVALMSRVANPVVGRGVLVELEPDVIAPSKEALEDRRRVFLSGAYLLLPRRRLERALDLAAGADQSERHDRAVRIGAAALKK
jgi:hypothetical protein